ncbi:hypothetical protein K461DRAFT_294803 [Myriangium duriaei CBS 260.36]|uniref:Sm domain-containing protein n=1 Tax=Myriangium duriaei CBS 260.36 TaxID=1168546 RepID=A0A9P4J3W7_9PEZI|nr:hypothetical protein K461DRAFT_294803 [Myriangium duriaei CBS 260.36]
MATITSSALAASPSLTNTAATTYLSGLLNRSLRIHINDGRMFVGNLKCTDRERNVVLATTYEYRRPSPQAVEQAMVEAARAGSSGGGVKVDMVRRFVGLVVVPGAYITKIETD